MPLVIARPAIHQKIIDITRPFAEEWKKANES